MLHTQVELTSPTGDREVWWLPVPSGKAKVGEKITRNMIDYACAPTEDAEYQEDWTITGVFTTLREEKIPNSARVAKNFKRESQTLAFMSI